MKGRRIAAGASVGEGREGTAGTRIDNNKACTENKTATKITFWKLKNKRHTKKDTHTPTTCGRGMPPKQEAFGRPGSGKVASTSPTSKR